MTCVGTSGNCQPSTDEHQGQASQDVSLRAHLVITGNQVAEQLTDDARQDIWSCSVASRLHQWHS